MTCRPCNRAKPPEPWIIRRGTSPVMALLVGEDVSEFPIVMVSVVSSGNELDFPKERLEFETEGGANVIRVPLSQDETLQLDGRCHVQLRCVDAEGRAYATAIRSADVANVINQEVLR